MTSQKPIWGCGGVLLILGILLVGIVLRYRIPQRDSFGTLPQSVADDFVTAVNLNDVVLASSYWKEGSIEHLEKAFEIKFEVFCEQMIQCDTYTLEPIARQKGDSFLVQFEGNKDGKRKSFGLYLKRVEGKWKLVR
jgi:hypothetical protein